MTIGCKAGDLIVWDSRTVHCNTPAAAEAVERAAQEQEELRGRRQRPHAPAVAPTLPPPPPPAAAAAAASALAAPVGVGDGAAAVADTDRELIRMVGYVCMVPASRADKRIRKSRLTAYASYTQTSHWPDAYVQPTCVPVRA